MNNISGLGLDQGTMERIRAVFVCHPEVETVKIYGSRAKGNFRPGSDIDLALIGQNIAVKQLNKISNELDDLLLPYSFDLSVLANISNHDLVAHIERVGRTIYQRKAAMV